MAKTRYSFSKSFTNLAEKEFVEAVKTRYPKMSKADLETLVKQQNYPKDGESNNSEG
jgi:hypothetical protein